MPARTSHLKPLRIGAAGQNAASSGYAPGAPENRDQRGEARHKQVMGSAPDFCLLTSASAFCICIHRSAALGAPPAPPGCTGPRSGRRDNEARSCHCHIQRPLPA
jgi:hypothetical protein